MQIAFGPNVLTIREIPNYTDFSKLLKSCTGGSTLVGSPDAEQFFAVLVQSNHGARSARTFGVGVQSGLHGLQPILLIDPSHDRLYFAVDQSLDVVDVSRGIKLPTIACSSPIYALEYLSDMDGVLVIHEIGVFVLHDGKTVWGFERDIISGWERHDSLLNITFLENLPPIQLRLQDGTEVTRE